MSTKRDQAGRSEIHYYALANDADAIDREINAGVDIDDADSQGFTPLHLASQEYSVDSARLLVNRGATVDSVNSFGNTALFVAVFNSRGRGDIIELLLSHGADPQHRNNAGQTPAGLARLVANYDLSRFFADG